MANTRVWKRTAVVVAIITAIGGIISALLPSRTRKSAEPPTSNTLTQSGNGNQSIGGINASGNAVVNVGNAAAGNAGQRVRQQNPRIIDLTLLNENYCEIEGVTAIITNLVPRTTPQYSFTNASDVRIAFFFHIADYGV